MKKKKWKKQKKKKVMRKMENRSKIATPVNWEVT